jgi:short chain dehydrogenase
MTFRRHPGTCAATTPVGVKTLADDLSAHLVYGFVTAAAWQLVLMRNGRDHWGAQVSRADAVAIVTGGSSRTGREVARALASWGWAIVVVYLEHQRRVEATVEAILATEARTVAVRADLADGLDVERLFAESILAFGGVDVVVHTTADNGSLLYRHAARSVRECGAIVSTSGC